MRKVLITTLIISILFGCQKTEKKDESKANYAQNSEGQPIKSDGTIIDTTTVVENIPVEKSYTPTTKNRPDYKIPDETGYSTLSKLSIIFAGNYSEEEIEIAMNRALKLYGFELTNENYNKVGSVLLELTKNDGNVYTEMELLRYTTKIHQKNTKFADMAAMASVFLTN